MRQASAMRIDKSEHPESIAAVEGVRCMMTMTDLLRR